jgi:hypothetical protein
MDMQRKEIEKKIHNMMVAFDVRDDAYRQKFTNNCPRA